MARMAKRQPGILTQTLEPTSAVCAGCEQPPWVAYHRHRRLVTLNGVLDLRLKIRRCHTAACPLYKQPIRPEGEGALALPHGEVGLDVIALIGALRYAEHRSVPEIQRDLVRRGVSVAERSVTNLLQRYDELVALALRNEARLQETLRLQGRVILALDGLQPDVGHEVLWVLRDCLSGAVLLARSLLGSNRDELAPLLREVADALPVPIQAVVSDGQPSIRRAVQLALPGVPHQLCQFHFLREATRPIYEADRHAKKELKKQVRGIRPIERALESRTDAEAEAMRGYCLAVRSALTDDGRPPLCASGRRLEQRLAVIHASIRRVRAEKGARRNSPAWTPYWKRGAWRRQRSGHPSPAPTPGCSVPPASSQTLRTCPASTSATRCARCSTRCGRHKTRLGRWPVPWATFVP